jgi:hypothetical protein
MCLHPHWLSNLRINNKQSICSVLRMAKAVSLANLCLAHGIRENLQPHNMHSVSVEMTTWKWLHHTKQNMLEMNTSYKTKRNVCLPMNNARKCKTSSWMQIIKRPKNCWINLHKLAGKRKSRPNGCREREETAFANWLAWAWYVVRIACVMKLNRKFIFVDSSQEFFQFSAWNFCKFWLKVVLAAGAVMESVP